MFSFDNGFPEKSDRASSSNWSVLLALCLRVAVFMNATRTEGPEIFHGLPLTVPFNEMRKFKAQPTNAFSLPSIKCSAAPPIFRPLPFTVFVV